MRCPGCGIEVSEHQKFCHDCGTALAAPASEPASDPVADPSADPAESVPESTGNPATATTEPVAVVGVIEPTQADTPTEQVDAVGVVDTPTEQVDAVDGVDTVALDAVPADARGAALVDEVDVWASPAPTTRIESVAPVTPVTAEMPALFDGHGDLAEYPAAREPFRFRLILLFALFGVAATLMTLPADVIDIRTTRPAAGIATGPITLDQLGSNLGLAGFIGAAVTVLGALLACFGLRWGAGLAGGAGLALAGWAAVTIGLAELPIAIAQSITRTATGEVFTLRVTRDLGWWLVIGVGTIGAIVFLASLRSIGTGGKAALNPLIAAVTAVAAAVLACGPLVPVNGASFSDNFRSVDPARDLPTALFTGRLTQVALIAFAGVVGMLLVRSYGVGLAVGGVSVAVWLWVTSLAEIGSNPIGIAVRNPGADTTVPHAVTTVGMVATLALLVIAAALATYRLNRGR